MIDATPVPQYRRPTNQSGAGLVLSHRADPFTEGVIFDASPE